MKASSACKADTPHEVSKIVKKPYAINPAERVKTKHRKVMKGADFIYGKGFNKLFNEKRLSHTFNIPIGWETVL